MDGQPIDKWEFDEELLEGFWSYRQPDIPVEERHRLSSLCCLGVQAQRRALEADLKAKGLNMPRITPPAGSAAQVNALTTYCP